METEHLIPGPFNPEDFRNEGHKVVDLLSDYLRNALTGQPMPVLPCNDCYSCNNHCYRNNTVFKLLLLL